MNMRGLFQSNVFIGIMLMLLHCFALSVLNSMSKMASPEVSPIQYSFFVSLSGFLIMIPFIIKRKYKFFDKSQKINILRSGICTFDQIILYYTLTQLELVHVTAVTLSYPIIATVMAVLVLKEEIRIRRIISIIIGIIGSIIIIDPTGTSFSPITLLVVVVVMCWGLLDVITKISIKSNPDIIQQVTFIMLFTSLFALPFVIIFWNNFDFWQYVPYLVGGGLSFICCMWSLYAAFKRTEICILVPLYFSTLVFSSVLGYYLFGETISTQTIIGSLIVTVSSIYIAYREYVINKYGR